MRLSFPDSERKNGVRPVCPRFSPKWRTAETTALAGSGAAATAAGGLILLDAAGISNIGNTQIGWRGGEITFTRPGKCTPDFRINPFGDDDWPPHYHRRPGIGKHRPWEGW